MASTKELLAQLTTQIAAALIVRSTGEPQRYRNLS